MALLSDYTAGTISVTTSGSIIVTGVGTAWKTAGFREGDIFIAGGYWAIVAADLESETELELVDWAGPELEDSEYRLRYMSDGSRASAQARQLIDMLGGSGNLEALGGLTGSSGTIPYFTGAGTMGLIPTSADGRSLIGEDDYAAMKAALGLATNQSPQFDGINLGHASDTTLTRGAAGQLNVEGSRVYQQNNILGTVSQSGGVPTGAIIERGSNANGEYVRFADGTQVCWHILGPMGSFSGGWRQNWTMPASFISLETRSLFVMPDLINSSITTSQRREVVTSGSSTGTSPTIDIYLSPTTTITPANETMTCFVMAIGRWF